VVTGVDDTSTYSCTVTATADGIPIGTSAAVIVDPIPVGQLPPTGSDALPTAWTAAALALAGVLLVVAVRRPRGKRQEHC